MTRWSPQDDRRLLTIIYHMMEGDHMPCWKAVAAAFQGNKNDKSCRLRWENQLRPDINHGPLDKEELAIVTDMQRDYGNKWSMIAKTLTDRAKQVIWQAKEDGFLPVDQYYPFRRTDNQVKNQWHGPLTGSKKRKAEESEMPAEPNCNALPQEFAGAFWNPDMTYDAQAPALTAAKRQRVVAPLGQLPAATPLPTVPVIQPAPFEPANAQSEASGGADADVFDDWLARALEEDKSSPVTDSSEDPIEDISVPLELLQLASLPDVPTFQASAFFAQGGQGEKAVANQAVKGFTFPSSAAEAADFMCVDPIHDLYRMWGQS